MGFNKIKVKFLCNNIKSVTLKLSFVVSGQFLPVYFLLKSLLETHFDLIQKSISIGCLDNQTFSLSPNVRAHMGCPGGISTFQYIHII